MLLYMKKVTYGLIVAASSMISCMAGIVIGVKLRKKPTYSGNLYINAESSDAKPDIFMESTVDMDTLKKSKKVLLKVIMVEKHPPA